MGCGGTGGGIAGLLPLDSKHPDLQEVFQVGDVEDDFEIEKEPIARGKFASVRLACHRVTKEIFAAKFIRRRRRGSNLEEEARHEVAVLLRGRSDSHIVHLHQVYETRTEYIIILEFGAGGDLQRLLDDQGRFQEKTVKDLLIQILKGLHFLHQHHIAHLDIKPQNLVLMGSSTEDGLKLVDFGLSRFIQQDTELTQIMGTPDYVAPEVINFECVNLATDMWSIGVLTYVFLSGYTPFGGDTDQETFVNITQGEFDFPDEYFTDVSEQAKDFISSLLIKNPLQRMTVEQCFSHPWLCNVFVSHRLLQLEPDSVDSGYSTDPCNGSPPSPDSLSSGYVSDLYQCSIPEESPLSCAEQFQPIPSIGHFNRLQLQNLEYDEMDRISNDGRKHRVSASHLSINVLECLQRGQRPQVRPLRRSSLVIPRYENEHNSFGDSADYNANRTNKSLYSPEYYKHSFSTTNLSWNNNSQMEENSLMLNQADQNALLNLTRPWKNLCNGSYTRALNQLNNKSAPKVKNSRTNLGLHPELSCSMFELKPSYDTMNMVLQPVLVRNSKSELRKSKIDLQSSKRDLRIPKELRGSIQDLRSAKQDLKSSKKDFIAKVDSGCSKTKLGEKGGLKGSRIDLSAANADFRCSKSDLREFESNLRCSKNDTRGSRHDLRGSKTDLRISKSQLREPRNDLSLGKNNNRIMSSLNARTIAHLNMSLSRLDLAQESLDNEEAEERDVVYGDCTLPRRFSRTNGSSLLHGNTFHMSFRKSKKKDGKF